MSSDLLDQILPHIEASIYPLTLSVPDWKYKEATAKESLTTVAQENKGTLIRIPFEWGKSQKKYWFKQILRLPETFTNAEVALRVDIPQGLAWVDGQLRQTLTPQQSEIPLTSSAKAFQEIFVSILAEPVEKQEIQLFSKAELVVVDNVARRLYHSLTMLRDVENSFEPHTAEAKEVRELIRRTLIFLKYFKPGSEEYPNAIKRAYAFLIKTLETECKATIPVTVHLTLLGEDHPALPSTFSYDGLQFLKKLAPTLHLAHTNTTLSFSQVGALYYLSLQQYAPRLLHSLKELITEKRLELLGNALTITDSDVHASEILIRRFLYERSIFQNLFQKTPETFFLPFPCNSLKTLPQILHHFGYTALLTTTQQDVDEPPSVFLWKGMDGTRILTAAVRRPHPIELGSKNFLSEIGVLCKKVATENDHLLHLLPSSTVLPAHIDKVTVIQALPGLPTIIVGTIEQFFNTLRLKGEQTFEEKVSFGEYSVVPQLPRQLLFHIVQTETLLRQTESIIANAFAKTSTTKIASLLKEVNDGWLFVIQPTLQGFIDKTVTPEFYTLIHGRYSSLQNVLTGTYRKALTSFERKLSQKEKNRSYTVFNPSLWTRSGYVQLVVRTEKQIVVVQDDTGKPVDTQLLSQAHGEATLLCYVKDVPPLSSRTLKISFTDKTLSPTNKWRISAHSLETPWYTIRLDKKGAITSLYAKHLQRELVAKGKKWNLISVIHETRKAEGEAEQKVVSNSVDLHLKSVKIVEAGPLRAVLRFDYRTHNQSALQVEMALYHATPNIAFITTLHCKERHTRISSGFALNLHPKMLVRPLPFGSESVSITGKEKGAVFTGTWFTISDSSVGFHCATLLPTELVLNRNTVSLQLLQTEAIPRHSKVTSEIDYSFYNIGEHTCSYLFSPFKGTATVWEVHRMMEEFHTPLVLLPETVLAIGEPPVTFAKSSIIVTAFKPHGNDGKHLLLRCYESEGQAVESSVRFGFSVQRVTECSLAEIPIKELTAKKDQYILRFKPHEIKTLLIELKRSGIKKRK